MYACWHMVSAALLLTSLALLPIGLGHTSNNGLLNFLGVLWVLFSAVFLFVTLVQARPRGPFRFPQWTLLLPVAVLSFLAGL